MPGRRRFLAAAVAAGLGIAATPLTVLARTPDRRELAFEHLWTGETLRITYSAGGRYDRDALTAIDHLLRDHRTAQTHRIDPALLDILWEVGGRTRARAPYQVICGYRSPATNSMLARRSSGVARRSLHMDGRAVDIRLPGVRTSALRDTAIAMRRGGVGYYRSSNFVHLDTGAFRTW
jgi:uncharacterized protein YcbK (DUF882 family)